MSAEPTTTTSMHSPDDLKARWAALREEQPRQRIRDAAAQLGTGEAQLLSTQLGQGVWRLAGRAQDILEHVPQLGEVMASTRNEHAVIEKHGRYADMELGEHVGLVLTPDIDLRLFFAHFHSAFVVEKMHAGRALHSLQFFAKDGTSLHKIYAQDAAGEAALASLRETFLHEDQASIEAWHAPKPAPKEVPDEDIDVRGFQQAWRGLQDTHDFFGLLRAYGLTRQQALRLAPEGFASRLDDDTATRALQHAARQGVPIMVFVSSPGCIEIHTGPVTKIVEAGTWINVMDPTFNLHLNRAGIHSSWCVKKPTADGIVTSLEFYDKDGGTVAMFFGERKPGEPELKSWRALVEGLTSTQVAWSSASCRGELRPLYYAPSQQL